MLWTFSVQSWIVDNKALNGATISLSISYSININFKQLFLIVIVQIIFFSIIIRRFIFTDPTSKANIFSMAMNFQPLVQLHNHSRIVQKNLTLKSFHVALLILMCGLLSIKSVHFHKTGAKEKIYLTMDYPCFLLLCHYKTHFKSLP